MKIPNINDFSKFWQNKEKIFDLEYFEENLSNFQKLINDKYLYTIINDKNKYEIKYDFENFIFSYFMQVGIDINFNDIASIKFNENSINIIPFRNLAGVIFFTNQRKNFWNDFTLACKFKDKEKLIKIP